MDKNRTEMDTTGKTETEPKRKGRFGAGVLTGMLGMLVIIAAAFGIRSWLTESSLASSGVSVKDVENKLEVINGLIDEYYLYEDEIDSGALTEGLYSGYTEALGDPYTEYYDEEETQALFESTSGESGDRRHHYRDKYI